MKDEFISYMHEQKNCSLLSLSYGVENNLYEKLYDTFFLGRGSNLSAKKIIVLAGAPRSGRTEFRNSNRFAEENQDKDNYYVNNIDEVCKILQQFVQYKDVPLDQLQIIAQEIADYMADYAILNGYNMIYDRTCTTEKSFFTIYNAKEQKRYTIKLYGFTKDEKQYTTQVQQETENKEERILKDIQMDRGRFSALWPYYLNLAKEAYILNTTLQETKDQRESLQFKILAKKTMSKMMEFDADKYAAFLTKGMSIDVKEMFPKIAATLVESRTK